MFIVKFIIILGMYPLVSTTKEAVKINKICDLLSEQTTNQCYVKEILASLAHNPNQLVVSESNILYFSFDFGQGEYIPALLNIETKKITVLKGIKDAFAISRDSATDVIYFGGSHGIYKYSPLYKTLKKLYMENLDIWWVQMKGYLYFIKFPSLKVYYYANRKIKPVLALNNTLVNQFVFDKEDNMFFINSTGLYGVKKGENKIIFVKDNPKFVGMAVDNAGHVHLCNDNGIYVITRLVRKVKKIVSIQGVLGITFDRNNNLIYSDSHEIVRLSISEYYKTHNSTYRF